MKVYISGPITGHEDVFENLFNKGAYEVRCMGNIPYNPAAVDLPPEADYEEYMKMSFAMLDFCEGIYMLEDWRNSAGANRELGYAIAKGYKIFYQENFMKEEA